MGQVTFVLTIGKNPNSWDLPQNHVMAVKPGVGKKFINYYKGENSVFAEDITNKDIKPSKVPSFTYNDLEKRTRLVVDDTDINLMMYLKTHPWFGKKYNITNKEMEAKSKLSNYENIEAALDLIKDADENKVKATALAVLGLDYYSKTLTECKAALKEKAINKPEEIINTMNAKDYESRYIASLALCKGIIKTNMGNTAIVWAHNEGVIIHIPTGEKGIDKLTEFLNAGTDEAKTLIQEFHNRVDKNNQDLAKVSDTAEAQKVIEQKDSDLQKANDEIAELKRQLEASKSKPDDTSGNLSGYADSADSLKGEEAQDTKPPVPPQMTLKEATAKYIEKHKGEVPTKYKNNIQWIASKLSETQNT